MDTDCLGMPSIDCDLVELDITELSEANRRWSHGPMLSSFATMTVTIFKLNSTTTPELMRPACRDTFSVNYLTRDSGASRIYWRL